ncbi:MAG TPA: hypothetical protein VGD66_04430 [Allosphingosinicella sp.]|jgi:hypothetical protein
MTRSRLPITLLAPPLLGLAGCAEGGAYPSLAQRPAERQYAEEMARGPVAATPAVADDPAIAARIAALTAEARQGQAEFDAAFAPAAAAVARAGPSGSDGWTQAQQAVSRAASAQGRTTRALADLDQYALERAQRALSAADRERLKAAGEALQALAAGQAERMARLEASLRRG